MKPEDLEKLKSYCEDFKKFRENIQDGDGNNLYDIKKTFDYVTKTIDQYQLKGTTFGSELSAKSTEASNVLSELQVCLEELEKAIATFVENQTINNNQGGGQGTATGATAAAGAAPATTTSGSNSTSGTTSNSDGNSSGGGQPTNEDTPPAEATSTTTSGNLTGSTGGGYNVPGSGGPQTNPRDDIPDPSVKSPQSGFYDNTGKQYLDKDMAVTPTKTTPYVPPAGSGGGGPQTNSRDGVPSPSAKAPQSGFTDKGGKKIQDI